MRDLQEIFNIRNMDSSDVFAMIWYTRGMKDGICGYPRTELDLPKAQYLILEYEEGFTMGRCMILARMKPK